MTGVQTCALPISSELEKGTCIDIYIPRLPGEDKDNNQAMLADEKINEMDEPPSGNETILLVDDEEALLEYSEIILSTYGYTILCAESAKEALEILENHPVDLMITDVIMPEMDGYQLAAKVKLLYPKVKIQIVSGYSDESQTSLTNESLHKNSLHKPVSAKILLITTRKLLDEDDSV